MNEKHQEYNAFEENNQDKTYFIYHFYTMV